MILSHAVPDQALLARPWRAGRTPGGAHVSRAPSARWLELATTTPKAHCQHAPGQQRPARAAEALRDLLELGQTPQRLGVSTSATRGDRCLLRGLRSRRTAESPSTAASTSAASRRRRLRRHAPGAGTPLPPSAAGEAPLPDVLLIDGGAGRSSRRAPRLATSASDGVLIVGVAKGEERRAGHETLVRGDDGAAAGHPGLARAAPDPERARRGPPLRHHRIIARAARRRARHEASWRTSPASAANAAPLCSSTSAACWRGPGRRRGTHAGQGVHRGLAERIYASFHG